MAPTARAPARTRSRASAAASATAGAAAAADLDDDEAVSVLLAEDARLEEAWNEELALCGIAGMIVVNQSRAHCE
eukprot:11038533-Alexandrium_andersonii.AAC.1